MSDVTAAVVGAVAVTCIPVFAWFSRRATKEGRLLLRVDRLGKAYALMPDSDEKGTFEMHLRSAVAAVNDWLDEGNRARRKLQRELSVGAYILGVAAVLIALPFADTEQTPWFPSVLGVVVGIGIALVSFGSSFLLDRGARKTAMRQGRAREEAEASRRMEAIRTGRVPPEI